VPAAAKAAAGARDPSQNGRANFNQNTSTLRVNFAAKQQSFAKLI
jgi:hypothetical protein